MMTHKIPRLSHSVDLESTDPSLSLSDTDLFYDSLEDEDLEEVFGEFLVPAEPIQ